MPSAFFLKIRGTAFRLSRPILANWLIRRCICGGYIGKWFARSGIGEAQRKTCGGERVTFVPLTAIVIVAGSVVATVDAVIVIQIHLRIVFILREFRYFHQQTVRTRRQVEGDRLGIPLRGGGGVGLLGSST